MKTVTITSTHTQPEDNWFCIAHLSAEDILKSAGTEPGWGRGGGGSLQIIMTGMCIQDSKKVPPKKIPKI